MIKENEIRVGNYFKYNEKHSEGLCMLNIPMKWDASDWYRVGECIDDLDWYNPIPLTEDILLKCGFELVDKNVFWLNDKFMFVFGENALSMARPDCVGNEDYTIPMAWIKSNIKHLHQLQNLYFALTGEELNVNL